MRKTCCNTATQDMKSSGDIDDLMNKIKEFVDITIEDMSEEGREKTNSDVIPAPEIAVTTNEVNDAAKYECPPDCDIVLGCKSIIDSSLEE